MRRIYLGGTCAALVLLAGCGSSSSKSASTSTGATSAATMTRSQAEAIANTLLLQPADVPGFTGSAREQTAEDKQAGRELTACAGGAGEAHQLAEANSKEFKREVKGLPQAVSSAVSVLETPAYAEQDLRAIHSDRGHKCVIQFVEKAFARSLPSGSKVGAPSLSEGEQAAPGANGSFLVHLTIPLTVQGTTVNVYFDFVGFIRGHAEVRVNAYSLGEPFPKATGEHLFNVLLQRASSSGA
jgi:hypothetical protein